MRLAVLSDIHGNAVAFEAALADMDRQGFDQAVCLGDAIQGGPQPAEVVQMLRKRAFPVVIGNADAWLLTGVETGDEQLDDLRLKELYGVREWSLSRLNEEDRRFIQDFQPTITVDLGSGQKLFCFHGSPESFDEVILPTIEEDELRRIFQPHMPSFFTGGHVHCQFIRHIDRHFHFNPGSIGFAYRHHQPGASPFRADPWAEYAILTVDGNNLSLEFRRVEFDFERLIDIYRSSGRPYAEAAVRQYSG